MATGQRVNDMIGDRLLFTLLISLFTILFTWAISLSIGIYSAVRQYSIGDYLFTITMIDDTKYYTVGIGISMFFGGAECVIPEVSGLGIQSAGYLLVSMPVMILFIVMQKWFVRGLREGVLKF